MKDALKKARNNAKGKAKKASKNLKNAGKKVAKKIAKKGIKKSGSKKISASVKQAAKVATKIAKGKKLLYSMILHFFFLKEFSPQRLMNCLSTSNYLIFLEYAIVEEYIRIEYQSDTTMLTRS